MDCGLKGLTFNDLSLTRSEFAQETDIGFIVKRFLRTGQLPGSVTRQEFTSDEGLPADFQELQDSIVRAKLLFESQPLEIRNKFNNDPEQWFMSLGNSKTPSDPQSVPQQDPQPDPQSVPQQDPAQ